MTSRTKALAIQRAREEYANYLNGQSGDELWLDREMVHDTDQMKEFHDYIKQFHARTALYYDAEAMYRNSERVPIKIVYLEPRKLEDEWWRPWKRCSPSTWELFSVLVQFLFLLFWFFYFLRWMLVN